MGKRRRGDPKHASERPTRGRIVIKKLIIFDLDGTLAASKSPLDKEMAQLLGTLLGIVNVAVISGGAWDQFQKQLLADLPGDAKLARLSLLPTCGTKFYRFDAGWHLLYAENLTGVDRERIIDSLHQVMDLTGSRPEKTWGEIIEDRGSQITFSALGQKAPIEAKECWDPDFATRKAMKEQLEKLIPRFSVRLGGTTSIDITKTGIDKAYGIRKLRDTLGITIDEMLFIGDALFPGGNDYPAKEAGVDSIQVRDPIETKHLIEAIIACLDHGIFTSS